jgi:hypothetical protein
MRRSKSVHDAVAFLRSRNKGPWLVLGTGPATDDVALVKTWAERHFTMTLARACKLVRPTVALFMDMEPYQESLFKWLDPETPVCLPWHPHVGCKPCPDTLQDFVSRGGVFSVPRVTVTIKHLLSFNSTTAGKLPPNPELRTVKVRHFSAVAAFNLLALAGVTEVYSLGVDGGTGYGKAFDPKDRLRNGRKDFDAQFPEIEATCRKHKIKWTRLAG